MSALPFSGKYIFSGEPRLYAVWQHDNHRVICQMTKVFVFRYFLGLSDKTLLTWSNNNCNRDMFSLENQFQETQS